MTGKETCAFGAKRSASDLHPALQGDALDISCDAYGTNGQVLGKPPWVYLPRYGIGLELGYVASGARLTSTIKAVRAS